MCIRSTMDMFLSLSVGSTIERILRGLFVLLRLIAGLVAELTSLSVVFSARPAAARPHR